MPSLAGRGAAVALGRRIQWAGTEFERGIRMIEWIVRLVGRGGYWAVLLLMFGENVFPPIPSELIMPLAGFSAARGDLNLTWVIVFGTIGSLLGGAVWYAAGRALGRRRVRRFAARHGRWLTLSPSDFDKAHARFDRHRGPAVFIGRLIPGARTLISVPAGVAKMPVVPFLLYSAAGTVLWTGLLAVAGYLLKDQYTRVSNWIDPIANVLVGGLVVWYVYRVITFKREPDDDGEPEEPRPSAS
jgi:membrane protein DedA with SNARE-associated domain